MKLTKLFLLLLLPEIVFCQENHSTFFKNELGIDFRSKPTVIEFWTTWCGPCITALKASDTLVTKYRDEINFYAITDEKKEALDRFLSKRKFNHTFFRDSLAKSHKRYDITGIPYTLLVNAKGNLVWEGHPGHISDKFLKKFMKGEITGFQKRMDKIVQKTYSLNSDKTYSLSIFPPDPAYDGGEISFRFSDFNSFVIWPNRTLRYIIRNGLDIPNKDLEFPKDLDSLLEEKSSVVYSNKEDLSQNAREDLVFKVVDYYNISVSTPLVKEQIYYISSVDTTLLNQYKTILNSKEESNIRGFHIGNSKGPNGSIMLGTGLDLKNMTYFLNKELSKGHIELYEAESGQYDLEIPVHSIEAIVNTLSEKYGIRMSVKEKEIKKYILFKNQTN